MDLFFLNLKWIIRHFSVATTGLGRIASPDGETEEEEKKKKEVKTSTNKT